LPTIVALPPWWAKEELFAHPTNHRRHAPPMLLGVFYALIAGLLWGLVFIVPLLLPNQSPALLSLGRYLAFGCVCVPLAAFQWRALRSLTARDWRWAFSLSVVGNCVYYGFLAFAIQTLGNPLPALIIGTLPVVIALCANLGLAQNQAAPRVAWRSLALPAGLLLAGLGCVNGQELGKMTQISTAQYWLGLLAALCAVAAWTWYPLYNDRHLKQAPHIKAVTWATAQGLATLLPAAVLFVLIFVLQAPVTEPNGLAAAHTNPLANSANVAVWASVAALPERLPPLFWTLMLTLGFASSWLGTLCWNASCQRLPAAISGQLIVFETLAALAFGYVYRGQWPSALSALGITLLVAGVLLGVRSFTRIK
jgi:drug/metabolite transporter (DMT)-like permease